MVYPPDTLVQGILYFVTVTLYECEKNRNQTMKSQNGKKIKSKL